MGGFPGEMLGPTALVFTSTEVPKLKVLVGIHSMNPQVCNTPRHPPYEGLRIKDMENGPQRSGPRSLGTGGRRLPMIVVEEETVCLRIDAPERLQQASPDIGSYAGGTLTVVPAGTLRPPQVSSSGLGFATVCAQ